MILIDTSVAIPLRDGDAEVIARAKALPGARAVSVMTLVELENGVMRERSQSAARRARLDMFLTGMTVLPFDLACAARYRAIIEALGFSRRNTVDRMIAATALAHGFDLVTANTPDFAAVPDLVLHHW